ncbi:hypothetical protein A3B45_04395 [Candidatus Daviesbacteria bacterium RIFCSPLOWO2_01_FULL_39_12]|uniref:TRAM domain-containing protein n=1 Tax=Candidatus Daviesbacteria bacterium RIFCSPLOWO2_01_FULL_39_12 TaxID=1797785 RepID=A0A1F5KN29_9BACT|nr:MAG: hypothetical protein A3B45_04395 [Candidatus Daviesbacteria bacterium RIFCSPLOWO2_01_FULL_39_12]
MLIPPEAGVDSVIVKVLITLMAGAIGFAIFPDIARRVRALTTNFFNFIVHRVSSEVSSQIVRLRGQSAYPATDGSSGIGSVSITRPLILDTSAVIDGRIADIAKTGFISGLILVPRFVLGELQQVADSKDDLKRQRGRRGFEVIEELKKNKGIRVEVWDKDQSGKLVDDKILNLAKSLHGKIITTDFNLNKVASLANIGVLNVNDLSNAVKALALPGEEIEIKIVHLGKDTSQGVGYLPDGTMAVVAEGADQIGKTITVEVTKSLQIPAGRMIFGKKI